MAGPLAGIRVVEIGSVGPTPFAAMMLADHGAEVIRIDRPGAGTVGVMADRSKDVLLRSRRSCVLDLKHPAGVAVVRELCRSAHILVEGLRPGVMERLSLGPQILLAENPRLVFGRMTGWGQSGPRAQRAGHDLTYIAVSGNLHGYGRAAQKPTPPSNAVGDFGGGGMLLAFGVLAALHSVRTTGRGQVIDCAMLDGAALLATMTWGMVAEGSWRDERGVNLLDSGAPHYDTYETRDGKYLAVAALEPQFFATFRRLCGLDGDPSFRDPLDRAAWPAMARKLTALFKTRTREEWCAIFDAADACVAPVLSMAEARVDAHNVARRTFVDIDDTAQPAPAPRFAFPAGDPLPPRPLGADTRAVLAELGYDPARIAALQDLGVLG